MGRVKRNLRWLAVLVLFAAPAVVGAAAPTAPSALAAEAGRFQDAVGGKDIRHRYIRDALSPLFADDDGRDRFLLGWVAAVRGAGITDGRIRRLTLTPIDIDDDLGYAVYEARACGRWYGWIPRCTTRELRWREIEDRWQLVPPDTVRLDPRDL
jgi:hypothetical protein